MSERSTKFSLFLLGSAVVGVVALAHHPSRPPSLTARPSQQIAALEVWNGSSVKQLTTTIEFTGRAHALPLPSPLPTPYHTTMSTSNQNTSSSQTTVTINGETFQSSQPGTMHIERHSSTSSSSGNATNQNSSSVNVTITNQ